MLFILILSVVARIFFTRASAIPPGRGSASAFVRVAPSNRSAGRVPSGTFEVVGCTSHAHLRPHGAPVRHLFLHAHGALVQPPLHGCWSSSSFCSCASSCSSSSSLPASSHEASATPGMPPVDRLPFGSVSRQGKASASGVASSAQSAGRVPSGTAAVVDSTSTDSTSSSSRTCPSASSPCSSTSRPTSSSDAGPPGAKFATWGGPASAELSSGRDGIEDVERLHQLLKHPRLCSAIASALLAHLKSLCCVPLQTDNYRESRCGMSPQSSPVAQSVSGLPSRTLGLLYSCPNTSRSSAAWLLVWRPWWRLCVRRRPATGL